MSGTAHLDASEKPASSPFGAVKINDLYLSSLFLQRASLFDVNGGSGGDTLRRGMSSALAATTGGSKSSGRMPDLSLVEAAAVAAASPTRSEAEEDEELNAAAAEAVRNLRSPKSDEEEMDEVRDENGRHSERRCEDDDDDRKGLKDDIDNGENKEKQVSQSVSQSADFFCK